MGGTRKKEVKYADCVQDQLLGNFCKKCGRHLVIVALEGRVFEHCLRCDHKEVIAEKCKPKEGGKVGCGY